MLVVSHFELQESAGRSHPWGKTTYSENAGEYCSFREKPELIREVLEDFKPHESQKAILRFYELLEWVNRPSGLLETNDCYFRPPSTNPDEQFVFSNKVTGRVEFFFRDLQHNINKGTAQWLYRMLSLHLQIERPDFHKAIFDIAGAPTDYLDLPGAESERTGVRFCVYFSAYGNGDPDTWSNLEVVVNGLLEALKSIERGMEGSVLKFS